MNLKVYNDSFPLVLISALAVDEFFDQYDLSRRQNSHTPVLDKFHENWIHNGIILVPSFHICGHQARVGMGRHRLTMLSRHMNEIPAAFEETFSNSDELENVYCKIVLRKMDMFEEFEYPDLPIENLGDDINGGSEWKRHVETLSI